MTRALAAALLLALASAEPTSAPASAAIPARASGAASFDAPVQLDGGLLLSDAQAVAVAQRIRRCEAERDYMLDAGVPETVPLWVPAIVGLAAGVAVGVGVSRLGPLTKP